MRLGVALPFHAGAVASAARAAEAAGFDSVWVLDAHNRGFMLPDPFVALGLAAAAMESAELGSTIIQAPLRARSCWPGRLAEAEAAYRKAAAASPLDPQV